MIQNKTDKNGQKENSPALRHFFRNLPAGLDYPLINSKILLLRTLQFLESIIHVPYNRQNSELGTPKEDIELAYDLVGKTKCSFTVIIMTYLYILFQDLVALLQKTNNI